MSNTVIVEAKPGDKIIVTVDGKPSVILYPQPDAQYVAWDEETATGSTYAVPGWSASGVEAPLGRYQGLASATATTTLPEPTVSAAHYA